METEQRARFLSEAARYLSETSISSSAHLITERSIIIQETNLTIKKSKLPPACQTCGTIFMPGLTSRKFTKGMQISNKPAAAVTQGSRKPGRPPISSELVGECLRCGRIAREELPIRSSKRARPTKIATVGTPEQPSIKSQSISTTQSSNRKRKKPKGLLSKSKEDEERAKAISGLDLMDLMKQA